jgi:hypothetical protein
VRLQSQSSVLTGSNDKYTLDQFAVEDIKSALKEFIILVHFDAIFVSHIV